MRNNGNTLRKAEIDNTHFHYTIAQKEIICNPVAFYCQRNLCRAKTNLKGIIIKRGSYKYVFRNSEQWQRK